MIRKADVRAGFSNRSLWLMLAFFALTLLSAVMSHDRSGALGAVEIKLSFFIMPWLLFCFKWPLPIIKRCVTAFVSGCFFACLYLILRASIYTYMGGEGYFFYTLFSDFIHASYFAMYLVLAIVFVLIFFPVWFKTQRTIIYSSWLFTGVFIGSIFLCSSKAGILSMLIAIPLTFYYKYRRRLHWRMIATLIASCVIVVFAARTLFPQSFQRLNALTNIEVQNIDKSAVESTSVRLLIWHEAAQIVKEHFWLGTGVGDANNTLYSYYAEHGITGALQHRFNAHNQFLQTFIGMGIFGLALLLLLTVGQVVSGIMNRNFLLFLFSLVIVLNFLVESMLQTSAGVLFFSFFYCLFNLAGEKDLMLEMARDEDLSANVA
jgi:O-antigen ligase